MKTFLTAVVLLLCTVLITKAYLHPGIPYTHDGENHLARFANYKIALREGQIPPRFAPNLVNRYGYPVFNYNYPLANILSAPFSFLHVEYEITFKLLVVAAIFFGSIGAFLFANSFENNNTMVAVGAVILWFASPYLFNLILFRGSIGEIFAITLLPWMLWAGKRFFSQERQTFFSKILIIMLWASFFLSHNTTVLFGSPLILAILLFHHWKQKKAILQYISLMVTAILLTLWFWLPALLEISEIIVSSAANQQSYISHFVGLHQLLDPLSFGFSEPGTIDGLSFSPGFFQLFLLLSSLALLTKKVISGQAVEKIYILYGFFASSIIFMQLESASFLWKNLPLVNYIQFPWRLSIFLSVLLIPISIYVLRHLSEKIVWIIVLLLFGQMYVLSTAIPVDYRDKSNADYDAFGQSTSTQNENLPKNFRYTDIGDWQPAPKIVEGVGEVEVKFWNGSSREYELLLTTPAVIVEPTMNFLGWETTVSLVDTPDAAQKVSYRDDDTIAGRLAFKLEPGQYLVTTVFTQHTPARTIGNLLSGATFIVILLVSLKKYATNSPKFHTT